MSDNSLPPTLSLLRKIWFKSAKITDETLASDARVRQIGLIYGIYRILVSTFLLIATYALSLPATLLSEPLFLFSTHIKSVTLISYFFVSILLFFVFYFFYKDPRKQLFIGLLLDMLTLTLLLYTGAATDLQIVILYMVVIATSFMLLPLSRAAIIAFFAILSLVYQQFYIVMTNHNSFLSLTDTIMLSFGLLAVGFISWSVSQRLSQAEFTVFNNSQEIERLNAINQAVVNHIENGVIVIGGNDRLAMINQSAQKLLRFNRLMHNTSVEGLFDAEQTIARNYPLMTRWYRSFNSNPTFVLSLPQDSLHRSDTLRISKKNLPEHGQLLIIEDVSRERSHAQQLKLASLGQLTASIAHEIRNPLGAISQASQLLMEDDANNPNQELYEIIYLQTKRVNRIIEDVMRLSRQEPPKQDIINLSVWLKDFLTQHFPEENIAIRFDGVTHISFDPHQLEQIFINLVNNALRHTKPVANMPDVEIIVHQESGSVLVDVLDNGDGVPAKDLPNLFNPFFTTSQGGTGLGLYLSLAFSEANHAKLTYVQDTPKTCFRLIVSKQVINDVMNYKETTGT